MHGEMSVGSLASALAFGVLALSGCGQKRDNSAYWETEREVVELTQKLKLAEYRLGLMPDREVVDIDAVTENARKLDLRARELRNAREALSDEINDLEARKSELAHTVLRHLRSKAHGRKFDTFSTTDGRIFENVMITGVDDGGIALRHAHGTARLRYADLSGEQCAEFGLDEKSALAAEDRERREAVAYEQRIDEELDAMRDKEERNAAMARRSEEARISRSLMARSASYKSESPLAKPASAVGSGSYYRNSYGSTYRTYRPRYRYVYYYPATPNPFYSYRSNRNIGYNGYVIP